MAAPGIYNITHVDGDTFRLNVVYRDSGGTAVNLTGYTVAMQVRERAGGTVWASSTGGSPSLTITVTAGTGTIDVSGTIDATPPARGVYDLQLTSSGGIVDTILAGDFTVIEEVTA